MTWVLKSGLVLDQLHASKPWDISLSPDGKLRQGSDSTQYVDRELMADGEYRDIDGDFGDGELTPSERAEIAAAVIGCWQRWAKTGKP